MALTGVAVFRMTLAVLVAGTIGLAPASLWAETTGTETLASDGATTSGAPIVCVVSGEKLGSMGEPVTLQHNGRTVRFCCKSCVDEFKKDPDKYLKKLDEQAGSRAQAPSGSGSGVCVVSGKAIPAGGGREVTVNNQTVKLCCGGCEATLRANPEKYLGKALGKEGGQGGSAGQETR